jgi:hypothetical protein
MLFARLSGKPRRFLVGRSPSALALLEDGLEVGLPSADRTLVATNPGS